MKTTSTAVSPRAVSVRRTVTAIAMLVASAGLVAAPSVASEPHHTVMPPEKLTWQAGPPTLPRGAQIAVLHGHPGKDGPFVIRLKFPADFQIPAHRHSKEEHVTVISGRFGMGTGDKLDRAAAPLLPPGSFVRIPSGMSHFAWTDQETVVQINGMGPFDVVYVDPADDPRKKAAQAGGADVRK